MIHNVPIIAELATICREYWNKISILEGDKYDLEMVEQLKKWEVKIRNPHEFLIVIFLRLNFIHYLYSKITRIGLFSEYFSLIKTTTKNNSKIDMKIQKKRYESERFSGIFSFGSFSNLIYTLFLHKTLISNFFTLTLINTKWLLPFDIHLLLLLLIFKRFYFCFHFSYFDIDWRVL